MQRIARAILDALDQPVERVALARSEQTVRRHFERKFGLTPQSRWYHWLGVLMPHKIPTIIDNCSNRRSA